MNILRNCYLENSGVPVDLLDCRHTPIAGGGLENITTTIEGRERYPVVMPAACGKTSPS